jgi:hypothetical protein
MNAPKRLKIRRKSHMNYKKVLLRKASMDRVIRDYPLAAL